MKDNENTQIPWFIYEKSGWIMDMTDMTRRNMAMTMENGKLHQKQWGVVGIAPSTMGIWAWKKIQNWRQSCAVETTFFFTREKHVFLWIFSKTNPMTGSCPTENQWIQRIRNLVGRWKWLNHLFKKCTRQMRDEMYGLDHQLTIFIEKLTPGSHEGSSQIRHAFLADRDRVKGPNCPNWTSPWQNHLQPFKGDKRDIYQALKPGTPRTMCVLYPGRILGSIQFSLRVTHG